MKLRGMFGALAGALLMAAATPAMAGLDFVDTATAVGARFSRLIVE